MYCLARVGNCGVIRGRVTLRYRSFAINPVRNAWTQIFGWFENAMIAFQDLLFVIMLI